MLRQQSDIALFAPKAGLSFGLKLAPAPGGKMWQGPRAEHFCCYNELVFLFFFFLGS